MTKITAAEVNNLRKTTGAGMMDCKKALVEAEGDYLFFENKCNCCYNYCISN